MQYYKFAKKICVQEMPTLQYVMHMKAVIEHRPENQIKKFKNKIFK